MLSVYHQAGDDDDEDGEEEDDGVETLWAPNVIPLLALQHVLLQERDIFILEDALNQKTLKTTIPMMPCCFTATQLLLLFLLHIMCLKLLRGVSDVLL